MIYYTHYRKMAAPLHESADVSSNNSYDRMTYYTHHKNMDGPHYVWTHVHCQPSAQGKREKKYKY
jgi:hypothetical protein